MNTIDEDQGAGDRFSAVAPSPLGPLLIVVTERAVVGVYHGHHDPPPKPLLLGTAVDVLPLAVDGLMQESMGTGPSRVAAPVEDLLRRARLQLDEYFGGSRRTFDLPIAPVGTPFQRRVWSALSTIPYGERRSYRDIATQLGNPRMGRAIGAAIRANPLSILVPGHRVISRSGGVVGYAAGTDAKESLLLLEAG
jgi:methylated-DNA-[protein]-cysteine S-methyltransferase